MMNFQAATDPSTTNGATPKERAEYISIAPDTLKFSPDSNHVAYFAIKEHTGVMVVDEVEGPEVNGVSHGAEVFSPDSQHVAYLAEIGGKHRAVMDGTLGPECDYFGVTSTDQLTFDAGGMLEYLAMNNGTLYRIRQKGKNN